MKSLTELYKIGVGPSSSHSMGPKKAAEFFNKKNPNAHSFRVILFGSLALTGKGHLTDLAIKSGLEPKPVEIVWQYDTFLPEHPNAMKFIALDNKGQELAAWQVYSIGGGDIKDDNDFFVEPEDIYPLNSMQEILTYCQEKKIALWEFIEQVEGEKLWLFLRKIWQTMQETINRGLQKTDILPGSLQLERKAKRYFNN